MKLLRNTIFGLIVFFLLIILVSFLLPSKSHLSRSLQMKAQPEQVFKLVNSFKNWSQWSPWYKKDTLAKYTFNEIPEGLGSSFSWISENSEVGVGSMKVVEVLENKKWKAEMRFDGMGLAFIQFDIVRDSAGIKVTWSLDSDGEDVPFYWAPFHKYMSLFMDKMVGPDFEAGLVDIKSIVEKEQINKLKVAGFEAEMKDLPAMDYIGIRAKLKGEEIGPKLNEFYTALMTEMKKQGVEQAGAPFTINYSANGDTYDMEACIPVKSSMLVSGIMKAGNKAATKALVIYYLGNYMSIGKVYQPGFEYLLQNNLKANAAPMEFYITDPMLEKDTLKWLTEVVFPCN